MKNAIVGSNRINLAYARMAPDDGTNGGNGGGGGEQQNQQAAPPQQGQQGQPPAPSLEQKVDALFQRMDQQSQVLAQFLQQSQQRGGEQEQEQEQTQHANAYVDPDTKAAIAAANRAAAMAQSAMDQQDQSNFLQYMRDEGLAEADAEQALRVHAHWKKNGINYVNGRPPSRIDAARYYLGATMKQRMQQYQQQNQNEQQRQQQNQHAQNIERSGGGGGGQYRAEYPDNFDKLPLTEQSKVIGKKLDEKFPDGW